MKTAFGYGIGGLVLILAQVLALPFANASDERAWIVTLGVWGVGAPDYEGSDDYEASLRPIFGIRREGSKDWLSLPEDSAGFAVYETGAFRFGPAAAFKDERDSSDNRALRGLDDVDFTVELGAFAEYWPAEALRTRIEVLHGVNGHEGLVANLSADVVFMPSERWTFTAGPRLVIVSDEYASAYFSVSPAEALASGLPVSDAEGGLHSAGFGVSASYDLTESLELKLFGEYDRLLGDAADSAIVSRFGSEDQFTAGAGLAYRFEIRP